MGNYQGYQQYKDSGVEWLGEIPEHWESLKIKRLTSIKRGASPRPIDDPKYFDDDGEYAWVRIADVTASERYLETTTQKLSELGKSFSVPLEPGELFLSIAGSVGKPIITKIKCCIHDGFVYFPDLKVNEEFIYYIFNSGQPYLGLGKLGTQLNLNTETVGAISIGLPSLHEQEKIAQFLDYKTKQIDELIKKKQTLIEKLDEKRTALISHAVTKGLDSSVPMKDSGIEWLGDIPKHWEVKRIKYAFLLQRGYDLSREEMEEGEYPVCASNGIIGNHIKYNVKAPSITVGRSGSVGEVHYIDFDFWAHNTALYVKRFINSDPKFIFYLLKTLDIKSLSWGTAVGSLNRNYIHDLFTGFPPLDEQKQIAEYLDQKTIQIDLQKAKIKQAIELLKEYRTSLITNAVTGKIDVRQVAIP